MANYDVQVVLHNANGLVEDDYVNTLHFEINAPDTLNGAADDIAAAYALFDLFSPTVNGMTVKFYEPAGGPPVYEEDYPLVGSGAALPSEVALCLSYYADDEPSTNGRRRGRIYVGPLNAFEAGVRPGPNMRANTLALGSRLAQVGNAGNTTWLMKSTTDNAYRKIERIGVDDAWDTQRRRGLAPSVRVFADVQ